MTSRAVLATSFAVLAAVCMAWLASARHVALAPTFGDVPPGAAPPRVPAPAVAPMPETSTVKPHPVVIEMESLRRLAATGMLLY